MTTREEYREGADYLIHVETGHVAAYGPEKGTDGRLWIASHWDKHPLDHEDAVHIEHLCVDAPRRLLLLELRAWEEAMDEEVENADS